MEQLARFHETLATYRHHDWQLAQVLMSPATLAQHSAGAEPSATPPFGGVAVRPAQFDALWFTRPSAGGREAWELRLINDAPYALFELFEPDEDEEDRADVRREMEARLRDHLGLPT